MATARRVARNLRLGDVYRCLGAEPSAFGNLQEQLNFEPILIKLMYLKRGIETSSACKNMIKLAA